MYAFLRSTAVTVADGVPKSEGSTCVVRDLAMALLQIEQMIDAKYLNPPLGMYFGVICMLWPLFG